MQQKELVFTFLRYLLLILIGLFSGIIYLIFAPLTILPVYWALSLFSDATLQGSVISFNNATISIIPACVSVSAYYLLLILNLTAPIVISKRIKSLAFLLISFLFLNIIRIIILSVMLSNSFSSFNLVHEILWYFGSIFLVLVLWFANVHIFKIQGVPFFTDGKMLLLEIKNRKNKN